MLTGRNGLINRAGEAEESTEIGEEKEKIAMTLNADLITDENGNSKTLLELLNEYIKR